MDSKLTVVVARPNVVRLNTPRKQFLITLFMLLVMVALSYDRVLIVFCCWVIRLRICRSVQLMSNSEEPSGRWRGIWRC
jgi:hypothetical protein